MQRRDVIEAEFEEPLKDVVVGYIDLGYSLPRTAEALEVNPRSLRHYSESRNLRFPRRPIQSGRQENRGRPAQTITSGGRTQTARAWADELGITPRAVYKRIRNGLTL